MHQEYEITITREGQVKVHMHGIKGKQCLEVAAWLEQMLGKARSIELTHEYYEPDQEVQRNLRAHG